MSKKSFVSFCFACLFGSIYLAADTTPGLKIERMPGADVAALMEKGEYVAAERLIRKQNADPRIIATILAYQGKKEESFAIFNEIIEKAPESQREEFFYQAVNLLTRPKLEQQFWNQFVSRGTIQLTDGRKRCAEVMMLLRSGSANAAKKLYEQVLESSYQGDDAIQTGLTFVYSQYSIEKAAEFQGLLEKMMVKFPKAADVRLKWIDTLSTTDPSRALAELDIFRKSEPKLFVEKEKKIHLIRGRSFEKLGERDRAKKEYQAITDSDPADPIANSKIREYEQREKIEQERQEKFRKQYPDYVPNLTIKEKSPAGSYLWLIAFNILGVVIIYLLWRRKKK